MIRKQLVSLATLSIALSFLGCQSDAQKMTRGAAKEYQLRYDNCIQSVEHFRRYAGFDFVEEMGVCQCNGTVCTGEEVCNIYGKCEKIKTDDTPECKGEERICISPTMGQICENNKWSKPINCAQDNKLCNYKIQGNHQNEDSSEALDEAQKEALYRNRICLEECGGDICGKDDNTTNTMVFYCENGVITHEKNCESKVSCTWNVDHDRAECGECLDGDIKCTDNQKGIQTCINGQWTDRETCVLCADGKCYQQICADNKDSSGGSETIYITEDGKHAVKECINGCNDAHTDCKDQETKECEPGSIKCEDDELMTCQYNNDLSTNIWVKEFCANGCNEEKNACKPECTPGAKECGGNIFKECDSSGKWSKTDCGDAGCNDDGCNSKGPDCTDNEKKCDNNQEWSCNNGTWVGGNTCDHGCNGKSCAKCEPGETQCVGIQIKTCTDGVWSNPHDCDEGKVCIGKECQLKPSYDKCKAGETKCDGEQIKTCTNGEWGNAENCPNPEEVCKSETQECGSKLDPPICNEGETQCINKDKMQTCTNGEWGDPQECRVGETCQNDKCSCIPGKSKCWDGYKSICLHNNWVTPQECPYGCNEANTDCADSPSIPPQPTCNSDWYYKCSGAEPFELKICQEKTDNSCWESKEDILMLTIDMTIDPHKAHLYYNCAKTEPFAKCDLPEPPANFNKMLTDIQDDTCNVTASSNSVILENCQFNSAALGAFSLQSYVEFIAENISSYKSKVKFNIEGSNTDNQSKIVITKCLTP